MRAIQCRTVLIVVAILGVTACSDGGSTEPVAVTGELAAPAEWIDGEQSGEPNPGIGYTHLRGTIIRSPITGMSDDRVNGDIEALMDIDVVVEDDRTTGHIALTSVTITNDGGSWEGTGEGTTTWTTSEPDHLHTIDHTLLGTGGYEGLQFTYRAEGVDYPWTVTGTIEPIDS